VSGGLGGSADASFYSRPPQRRQQEVYVYCVTTIDNAAIVVVLLDDVDLEPYIDGEVAYVPACVLNAGYAELVD
jgi:hypothetical protein